MEPNLPLDPGQVSSPLEPTTLQDVANRITASDVMEGIGVAADVAEGAGGLVELASGAVELLGGIVEAIGGSATP